MSLGGQRPSLGERVVNPPAPPRISKQLDLPLEVVHARSHGPDRPGPLERPVNHLTVTTPEVTCSQDGEPGAGAGDPDPTGSFLPGPSDSLKGWIR